MATVLKYFLVYFLSALKFVFGPALGIIAYDLPLFAVIILTALGMMTTVYLFTFFGGPIRAFLGRFRKKDRKIFTKKNRQFVRIWRRYGLKGVCFLTPLILTPPGGAILINVLGSKKSLIIKWMWISAIFWSVIICTLASYVDGFRDLIQTSV
ncbi:MAG: hypothetical protein ABJP45_07635 [Cyclobacteriaceae bacterium]